jgi:tetratricopeptide (TPR) repeat protein
VQASAVAAAPSQATPASAKRSPRPHRLLDALLVVVVLLLAFLVASFVARNSDLWQHLASGRLLLRGEYRFGVDPFASAAEGAYWANHSWLLDGLIYLLYQAAGGAGLVIAKALLFTALAGLMLAIHRSGGGWAVPAACTAVGVVAMSQRLMLQTACVSCLLLALCLWILWRSQSTIISGEFRNDVRRSLPLLALFVLWVNLDGWFFLGPLLAGLFWLGEGPGAERRTPWWLAPVGLGLCLLNPHHFHAFTLPAEFSPALGATLAGDARFQRSFASPWQVGVHLQPGAASLAGWAYFLLVLLGVVSFALERAALRGWRLPVWLGFALLGAWQVRTVPFFAVVAAPVTALNLQDFLARCRVSRAGALATRSALLAAGGALVVLCLLERLNGLHGDGRRIGWEVRSDPPPEGVARTLDRWRREGPRPGEAERMALAPQQEDQEEVQPAPAGGVGRGPRERTFWDRLGNAFEPEPAATWGSAATALFLRAHDDRAEAERKDSHLRVRAAFAAALTGQPALPSGAATAGALLFRGRFFLPFLTEGEERSAALPLLAVREARRALAANPDDALAWLQLGQAYFALTQITPGAAREDSLTPMALLRHVQMVTALENALVLNPDLAAAHDLLAHLYAQRRYLDITLMHAQAALALGRRAGPRQGESADAFGQRLDQAGRQVQELERYVQDLQHQFAVRSQELGDNALNKARLAVSMGLPRQALDDVLGKSQTLLFGAEAVGLQLDLLLTLGRAEAARQTLEDEGTRKAREQLRPVDIPAPPPLGAYRLPAYAWLAACRAAAAGDYDRASEHLGEVRTRLDQEVGGIMSRVRVDLPAWLTSELALRCQPQPPLLQSQACHQRLMLTGLLAATQRLRLEHADLGVLAGMLALERGEPGLAERHLHEADALARALEAATGLAAPGRPLALAYLRRIEAARAATGKGGEGHVP